MADPPTQLARDRAALLDRRAALGVLGGTGVLLAACGSKARAAACFATPPETRGPFAADGGRDQAGRLNVLDADGIVRSDIRSSFAGLKGTAEGVPLDLEVTLLGVAGGCNPMAGWALYLWQNDAAGDYSLYNLPNANYLRGMQQSGNDGIVRFHTILPGCYGGRAPHLHFEIYSSAAAAIGGEPATLASQFTFPEEPLREVYASDPRYGGSLANLDRWNAATDFVFRDASDEVLALQTIALAGDAVNGFRGTAQVGVRA